MSTMEFMGPTPGPFVGFLLCSLLNEMVLEWRIFLVFPLALFLGIWFLGGTLLAFHVGPTITLVALEVALLTPSLFRVSFCCLSISPRWWIDALIFIFLASSIISFGKYPNSFVWVHCLFWNGGFLPQPLWIDHSTLFTTFF